MGKGYHPNFREGCRAQGRVAGPGSQGSEVLALGFEDERLARPLRQQQEGLRLRARQVADVRLGVMLHSHESWDTLLLGLGQREALGSLPLGGSVAQACVPSRNMMAEWQAEDRQGGLPTEAPK
jgi:hypothetical protein